MESVSANRLSRKNQRGVSPIIATILLVAITVVLAAVLYILVTGLLGGHTSVTSAVTMTAQTGGSCADGAKAFNTYSIAIGGTTSTLTTANLGFSLTLTGASTSTSPGAATAGTAGTCAVGTTGLEPAATGWVAVLVAPGGSNVQAEWSGATPSWTTTAGVALPSAVTISGGQTIVIIAGTSVSLVQTTIAAYGTNGATVTGSVTL